MVDEDYKDRLVRAMSEHKPPLDTRGLATALGISYQAVRKVVQLGGRFGLENHAKAAKKLGVSPDWLASGKGEMRPKGKTVATLIREEREADPYELIERGLAALVIVGTAKDNVLKVIREYADIAAETQKALDERLRDRTAK